MSLITRRNMLFSGLSTAAFIGGALTLPAGRAGAKGLTLKDVLADPDNPVLGNPDGTLTIVEFFDYQ